MDAPGPSEAEQCSRVTAWSLCEEIERLVHIERKAACLVCHHFASLADRFDAKDPELAAYEDIYQLGLLRLGMPERAVRERVRVGRALRLLPQTRAAFADGAISYAKVREVTRIAEPASEEQWLQTARTESVRSLERHVARSRRGCSANVTDAPDVKRSSDGAFVEVQLRLPAATWALVQRAMEATRRRSQVSLSDAEALEAVARCALASRGSESTPSSPRLLDDEGERRFLDDVASRVAKDASTPGGDHVDAEVDAPESPAEVTRPGQDEVLLPAPGRPALSDGYVDAGRLIVSAIEKGAEHEEDLARMTGLSSHYISVALLELQLAGIVARTHKGLMLTPWALRHRFKAVESKLRH